MNTSPLKLTWFLPMVALFAANAGPVLPDPGLPLVKRAPAQATWTIEWSNPSELANGAAEKKRDEFVRVVVQKDGSTLREQAYTQEGQVLERWILAGREFVQREGRFVYVPSADEATDHFDYQKSDFPCMEWLDMQYYCGVSTHEGVLVYLFIRSEKKPEKPADASASVAQCVKQGVPFVLLSARQLPILYFDGRIMARFGEFAPLKGKLEPSADLTNIGTQLSEDLKEHRRGPSPP